MAYVNVSVIETFKRRAELGYMDKRLRLITNTVLFKTLIATTKNLKNKAVFNLKQHCICVAVYVTLSNIFQLMRIRM